MTLPLFVYGTLRDPQVRIRVLGDRAHLTTILATLYGHVRQTVPGVSHPFLVSADADDSVDGELILGLTEADFSMLDEYEDVEDGLYVRRRVTVQTTDGPIDAWTYLRGPNAPP